MINMSAEITKALSDLPRTTANWVVRQYETAVSRAQRAERERDAFKEQCRQLEADLSNLRFELRALQIRHENETSHAKAEINRLGRETLVAAAGNAYIFSK